MLPAERLALAGSAPSGDTGFAIVERIRGAMRIVATDAVARDHGITPGMALADARAQLPGLAACDHDPIADNRLIDHVADGCARYSPMVAVNPPCALTLDITGVTQFGDEAALAADIEARLARHGLTVRTALADSPEAAQALARFQTMPAIDEASAIRRLPVAALGIDDDTDLALRRAGLKTIGDLADRPTAPLSARFGGHVSDTLDRLLGRADSRIVPRRPDPALMFERRFAEPIITVTAAIEAIRLLGETASAAMESHRLGGRRFTAHLFRSDGLARDLMVETSMAIRDPAAIAKLFDEKLQSLADPIDPGFGFDLIRLAVPALEPVAPTQLQLEGGEVAAGELASLVDRLGARHGRGRFQRLSPRDSHLPEQATLALPMVDAGEPAPWPIPEAGEPPLRPLHLFDPPQRIDVIAEVPDGPPHRFRWRRTLHEVTRFEGPERIGSHWWRRDDNAGLTRDYYRIEDARGRRFWIFRHGLYDREKPDPGWYLHGLFA